MPKKKQSSPMRASASRTPVEPVGEVASTTTRIDPPHQIGSAEPAAPGPPAAAEAAQRARPVESTAQQTASQPPSFGLPLAESFEQMQSQAAQLAAQLRKQQATIDHREAEVNARAAAVESQVRTARLWLLEKLEELAQRKAELSSAAADIAMQSPSDDTPQPPSGQAPRSAEQDGQTQEPGQTESGTPPSDSPGRELTVPRGTLRFWKQLHWQEEFERWCTQREAAAEGLAAASDDRGLEESSARPGAAGLPAERSRATDQQLAERAAELEAWRRKLVADRNALEAEREAFAAERQADLVRLADQRRAMSEKLARQRARLSRRRDDFDARELALRQLRADLLRTQRQTLEMRLEAEELWARMRGKAPTAEERPSRANFENTSAGARHEGAA